MTATQLVELLVLITSLGAFWFAIEARYVRKDVHDEVVRGLREALARLETLGQATHAAVTERMQAEVEDAASRGVQRGVQVGVSLARGTDPMLPIRH